MYHIFKPECQTQLAGIEQFEMGHRSPGNPGLGGRFLAGPEGTGELLPPVLGGIGRGDQTDHLARSDRISDAGRAG